MTAQEALKLSRASAPSCEKEVETILAAIKEAALKGETKTVVSLNVEPTERNVINGKLWGLGYDTDSEYGVGGYVFTIWWTEAFQ